MVKKVSIPAALSVVLILVFFSVGIWFFFFRQTEESIIRSRFQEFSESVEKNGPEGGIKAVATAQGLGRFFAEQTSVDVDGLSWMNGVYSPELIISNAFRARQLFHKLSLEFNDIELEISGDTAKAFFTAVFNANPKNNDSPIREIRELEAGLRKVDGKWIFESFKVQNIIKK